MVVANISPSICSAVETLSTLKFSQRAKFIQNAVAVNEDTTEDISVIRAQIKLLKKELQHAQYMQKAYFYFFTTPPRRFNSLHDDSESPTDRTSDLESAYIYNGGQISSSASPVVSTAKCIREGGECSTNCMWKIQSIGSNFCWRSAKDSARIVRTCRFMRKMWPDLLMNSTEDESKLFDEMSNSHEERQ